MAAPCETTSDRVAAVVLAAGRSRRMGSSKALLDLGGQPLIARLLLTIHDCGAVDRVIVVSGHQPAAIHQIVADFGVDLVHNSDYESGGMLSSVRAGVRHALAGGGLDALFVMLLDQPLVWAATLVAMVRAWRASRCAVVVPAHDGRRGHPILIAAGSAGQILSLGPDATLRDFVEQHRNETQVVEVNDPGVLSDVDTPQDYRRIVSQWRTLTCPTVATEADDNLRVG